MNNFRALLSWAIQLPMSLFAGIGLLSVLAGIMELPETLATVIANYQSITHPVWDYTLSLVPWLTNSLPWLLTSFGKDYLTMGAVTAGATFTAFVAFMQSPSAIAPGLLSASFSFAIWPYQWVQMLAMRVGLFGTIRRQIWLPAMRKFYGDTNYFTGAAVSPEIDAEIEIEISDQYKFAAQVFFRSLVVAAVILAMGYAASSVSWS